MTSHSTNPSTRAVWSLLVKACFLALLWAGWVLGEPGPRNVVTFLIGVSAVVSFLMLFCDACQQHAREQGLPLPGWVHGAYGVVCIAGLAWHGSWWLAGLQVFSWAVTVGTHSAPIGKVRL